MNQVATIEHSRDIAPADNSPMQMLQTAIANKMDPATIKELMDLRDRWETGEARKAFHRAFADFKAEAVTILKGTQIKDGPLKGKHHADLFDVISATTEPLAKHGLTISWKTIKDEKDWMEVACTLKHDAGHSETESMGGAPDTGPGRNAIQARGSTRTYLQRYTAMAILGLAAKGMDDDGRSAGKTIERISEKQWGDLNTMLTDTKSDVAKFCQLFGIAKLDDLPASEYGKAMNKLKQKAKKMEAAK